MYTECFYLSEIIAINILTYKFFYSLYKSSFFLKVIGNDSAQQNSNFKDESLKIIPNVIIQRFLSFTPVIITLDISLGA